MILSSNNGFFETFKCQNRRFNFVFMIIFFTWVKQSGDHQSAHVHSPGPSHAERYPHSHFMLQNG